MELDGSVRTSSGVQEDRLARPAVPEPDDGVLWRGVMNGDADALGDLFVRYHKEIYNFLFRRTGDWAEAEDLTSVVFLELWRGRKRAVRPGMVRAWIYGVAANVGNNSRRSRRRHAAALRRLPASVDTPDFAVDADQRLDDERKFKSARGRLERLSRHDRDVIALCVWADLTYEETAEALGVPVGTVRSRLSRAKARIKNNPASEPNTLHGWDEHEGVVR